MNPIDQFRKEVTENIIALGNDKDLHELSHMWFKEATTHNYSYNFRWLGRPIIQFPQDILAMQEVIWDVKPDLIVETGIAHGGSLVFNASMLALLDLSEETNGVLSTIEKRHPRKVLGIDIDIRAHNRAAIENHPMSSRIQMIEGSSISAEVLAQVKAIAANYERVLVCLDSNHTHEHVLEELKSYAPLTSVGSYCVVFDTVIEDMPADMFPNRPWGPGDNPKTAVWEYLKTTSNFEIDKTIQDKLQITVAPDGFLKRTQL